MGDLEDLIGVTANALGTLLPAFGVVEQMANIYKKIKFARARCKAVIRRAALLIKGIHENVQKTGTDVPPSSLRELQQKLEEVQAIMQKLADMSFLKALLRSDLINQEIEMADRRLSDCLQIFQIELLFRARAEKDAAAASDRAALQDILKELKGNYIKIRRLFGISTDEEEDEAMVAMEKKLSETENEFQDSVETMIIKSSLDCIKSSTGKSAPKPRAWLITDYELDFGGAIGGGGFSTVRRAKFRGTTVAIKVLKDIGDSRKALEREIEIWSRLRHDHIVPFYGASTLASNPYIVCRYMRNGNLIRYLARKPSANRAKLVYEISLGMFYLHSEKIVHGDLKGVNVLVDDAGKACITDFGLSSFNSPIDVKMTTNKISGTLRFLAPEALKGQPLNFATDMYAFGMVIYEVFAGEGPFIGLPDHIVKEGNLTLTRPTSNEALAHGLNDTVWQLLLDATSRSPVARPNFATIVKRLEPMGESFSQTFELARANTETFVEQSKVNWTYGPVASFSQTLNQSEAPLVKKGLSQENPSFPSGSSLPLSDNDDRPVCIEVTYTNLDAEFGLVKSREPAVYLEETDSTHWQPVSADKGTLLRTETNHFTYRRTIAEGTNSWELRGNRVALHTSTFDAECCFKDVQAAQNWFDLQLSYARNGKVSSWGSSTTRVSGDWITKERSWRRIFQGKPQMAPSVEGAPHLMPSSSSWKNVDLPDRYTVDNADSDVNSVTYIAKPGSSRSSKHCCSVKGRTIVFTTYLLSADRTQTLIREETYPSEADARLMFNVTKTVLERGRKAGSAQSPVGGAFRSIFGDRKKRNTETKRSQDEQIKSWSLLNASDKQNYTQGIGAFRQWMSDRSVDINTPFLDKDQTNSKSDSCNVLSYNALRAVHAENWVVAYENAKKSIDIQASAMGYIAVALAQAGLNKLEEALETFDLVFGNCDPSENSLLRLIKAIIPFVGKKYDEAITRVNRLVSNSKNDETTYCYIQVLAKMFLMQGDYAHAIESLRRGQSIATSYTSYDLETISLIFGWNFDGLEVTVQRCHCEVLLRTGRTQEAFQTLVEILKTFHASREIPDWVVDLKKKCASKLEALGDEAFNSRKYNEAITRYSSALSLRPPNPVDVLAKRSEAQASMELWEDALADASEVVKLDPSSCRGYERKYVALHGAERYNDAIAAARAMFEQIKHSPDKNRLQEQYTDPQDTIAAIDAAINTVFDLCPLVLIDVNTGCLCNATERKQIFKSDIMFQKLASEAVKGTEDGQILSAVTKFFEWAMLSHTWEGEEPTFSVVNKAVSVWKLEKSLLNKKLQQFCKTAREVGYRWAWSDTCCIDKNINAVLNQSLTSMYKWYAKASATLVYLADVTPFSKAGGLTKSRWMTRAWTLQELLASKVVRFYDQKWEPYLNETLANHKESYVIMEELARAMGVVSGTITGFQPDSDLGVRERLRLASMRKATREEDIAYSLLGIFNASSNIQPNYGLGNAATGQLLEYIVARSGDVTVIAWTGTSLPYNSALPSSLAVYNQEPHSPPPIKIDELNTLVEELRAQLQLEDVLSFCSRVDRLPRAIFSTGCLRLPCIVFSVMNISIEEPGSNQGNLYHTTVSSLKKVQFRTTDEMPLKFSRKLVFVHPWIHDLRGPLDEFIPDDELEHEVEWGSESHNELDAVYDSGGSGGTKHTQALRMVARLGRPFSALLLEQQPNGQYRRVAAENEIIVPGVPYDSTDFKKIRVSVLEIV